MGGFEEAFSEVWSVGRTVGVDLLKQEGAERLAEAQTRQLIDQQRLYTELAQQSSNLGPNMVPAANRAAVTQAQTMQGFAAIEQLKKVPLFFWVAGIFFVGLLVYALKKK